MSIAAKAISRAAVVLALFFQQEREGGRMKQTHLGVLREDPHEDMRLMLENYTG